MPVDLPDARDTAHPCRPTVSCTADFALPGRLEAEVGALYSSVVSGAAHVLTFPFLLKQTFTPLLHQAFQIVNPAGGSTTVTLTAIRDLSPEASPGSNFRFSLLFEGSAAGALPQGTYQVTTRAGSAYTLLVVPVTQPTHNKVQYQVIVNNPG